MRWYKLLVRKLTSSSRVLKTALGTQKSTQNRQKAIQMLSNLTLIGMPGSGKSSIGALVAKKRQMGFVDTDRLIELRQKKTLQEIVDSCGYLELRKIEEKEILQLNTSNQVIATGGSAVYSEAAMAHLKKISKVIYLKTPLRVLLSRVDNFKSRGIASRKDQNMEELYLERSALYDRYAEITLNCENLSMQEMVEAVLGKLEDFV